MGTCLGSDPYLGKRTGLSLCLLSAAAYKALFFWGWALNIGCLLPN